MSTINGIEKNKKINLAIGAIASDLNQIVSESALLKYNKNILINKLFTKSLDKVDHISFEEAMSITKLEMIKKLIINFDNNSIDLKLEEEISYLYYELYLLNEKETELLKTIPAIKNTTDVMPYSLDPKYDDCFLADLECDENICTLGTKSFK